MDVIWFPLVRVERSLSGLSSQDDVKDRDMKMGGARSLVVAVSSERKVG